MIKRGDRIKLISCSDPYTRLERGERGTVALVDSMGTVHVNWDSGSHLGLVEQAGDRYRKLTKQEIEEERSQKER